MTSLRYYRSHQRDRWTVGGHSGRKQRRGANRICPELGGYGRRLLHLSVRRDPSLELSVMKGERAWMSLGRNRGERGNDRSLVMECVSAMASLNLACVTHHRGECHRGRKPGPSSITEAMLSSAWPRRGGLVKNDDFRSNRASLSRASRDHRLLLQLKQGWGRS